MELIPEMESLTDTKEFDKESVTEVILYLMKEVFLYLPNKYKKQKLANEWFSIIEDSLNVVRDGTEISLKNGSAQFLSVVYLYINQLSITVVYSIFLVLQK